MKKLFISFLFKLQKNKFLLNLALFFSNIINNKLKKELCLI